MPEFEHPAGPESKLNVLPLTGRIGARIYNVRLADASDETIAAIECALTKYKVLFFRDQTHLNDVQQEKFAARFGELVAHPTNPAHPGSQAIMELDSAGGRGRADYWHTDITFMDAYPKLSILRGVVIPPAGGDTVWANTVSAYETLPLALKTLADNLWAVHSNLYDYVSARPHASNAAVKHYEDVFTSTVYETEHPVVRVLPATCERSLVLGHFARRFVGLSQPDSNRLFELFQSHITRLENTVRWRWRAGDVAMWDNTATQHCAINDYGDQKRVVRRSTVKGAIPVSVNGRTSVMHSKISKSTRPSHSSVAA